MKIACLIFILEIFELPVLLGTTGHKRVKIYQTRNQTSDCPKVINHIKENSIDLFFWETEHNLYDSLLKMC